MSFDELVENVDRAVLRVFGNPTPVTYTPQGGSPVTTTPTGQPLIGIFDDDYMLAKASPQFGVEASGPAVFFRLEDLPVDPENDEPTITIDGVAYSVTARPRDDAGGIVLRLRRV